MNRLAVVLGVMLVIGFTGPVIFGGIALLLAMGGVAARSAVVLGFFTTVGIFVATIVNAILRNQR
jgi:hypothetical protein